jgi:hypothetical protein
MKVVSIAHIVGGAVLLAALHPTFFSQPFVEEKWWVFVVLGLAIGAYHASTFLKNTKRWIYLFHAAFVAPVILVLGIYPNVARQLLQLVASAMIAYHAAILADIL